MDQMLQMNGLDGLILSRPEKIRMLHKRMISGTIKKKKMSKSLKTATLHLKTATPMKCQNGTKYQTRLCKIKEDTCTERALKGKQAFYCATNTDTGNTGLLPVEKHVQLR